MNQSISTSLRRGFSLLEVEVSLVIFGIAVAGIAPLSVMQMKQVRKLQERIEPETRYYLVPAADPWARRLGAAATRNPALPTTPTYPAQAYINFQRSIDPAPGAFGGKNYLADVGSAFGDRGGGYSYGWNGDNTANSRNRNSGMSPDERHDTHISMQTGGSFKWEIAVPNGLYHVRLVAGDPSALLSITSINVEGQPLAFGITGLLKRWVEGNGTIVVRDGRLTVSNGLLALGNKLCFIEITQDTPQKAVDIVSIQKSLGSAVVSATVDVTSL